jgi:hypothetical protein
MGKLGPPCCHPLNDAEPPTITARDKIDKAVPLLPAARAAIEMAKQANNTVAAAITPATTPTGSEQ